MTRTALARMCSCCATKLHSPQMLEEWKSETLALVPHDLHKFLDKVVIPAITSECSRQHSSGETPPGAEQQAPFGAAAPLSGTVMSPFAPEFVPSCCPAHV
eukprot:Gregarina_sp_Poly_1__10376@NODE_743_length_6482_cov_29_105846_g554_i0_p8_GENE_NODE_743_length_6482_cov_29_105846_g554_i0NODE_743_length_6482_cov_29_105846_g554_i0_p8_ORF_typecomplete_len101_score17_39PAM2/PF07145_15/0_043_NODE_743_length_6482_cov_29_105846_g554_i040984400